MNIVSNDLQKLVNEYMKIKESLSEPISVPSKRTHEKIPKIRRVENNNKIILPDFSIIFTNLYKDLNTSLKLAMIKMIFNKLLRSVFYIKSKVSINVNIKDNENTNIYTTILTNSILIGFSEH